MKKVRVVSLACDMPTGPPLNLYQILSYYLKQYERWPAQDFGFRGDNYIMKKVRVVSLAHDMPTGPPSSSLPNIIKLSPTVWELWPAQISASGVII